VKNQEPGLAYVTPHGDLSICVGLAGAPPSMMWREVPAADAIAFARWILDTFEDK
jgi:hypothetical protein